MGLPAGTVTFLFTDMEGSTALVRRLGDEAYAGVLADHDRLLREVFHRHGGTVVDTQGDAFFVAFNAAASAVAAALDAQRAVSGHLWPDGVRVRVRIGLHTGEPVAAAGGYVGLDVNRAARISAAGYGGQILLSQTTRTLVEQALPPGARLLDLGEHRLKDLQKPERIYQVLHPDLPAGFPPIRSLSAVPNNLPLQLTTFVGREQELAAVASLLAGARLLTLIGPGGSGKTRLALHVAADALDVFPDGIWLVDLAPLTDGGLVHQAVIAALGLGEVAGSRDDVLVEALREKRALLILDNCEHLLDACAALADALLRATARLAILATSRERLSVPGEVVFPVPPLSLPPSADVRTLADLRSSEAAVLFFDRALLAQRGARFGDEAAEPVARIVRSLDGIPLAIELAAAKTTVLSVRQIAQRLDDRFRLLRGGSRTAPTRQQTLQAAMDWSYDLLQAEERALLRRLAVFAGGCTLEAVEGVCADPSAPVPLLDLLTALVDKSLVAVDHGAESARYRLLETIRAYAWSKMSSAEEAADLRRRHAHWFAGWVQTLEPRLASDERGLGQVQLEHDNLRAALEWAIHTGAAELALRLGGALCRFWSVRGYWSEGRHWLETALALPGAPAGSLRARALLGVAEFAQNLGDYARARAAAAEAAPLFDALADDRGRARVEGILGSAAYYQGDLNEAERRHTASLTYARRAGDLRSAAGATVNLATIALHRGDFASAERNARDSLQAFREAGDRHGEAFVLNLLGTVAADQARFSEAVPLFEESLRIRRALGDRRGIAASLTNLGRVAHHQGDGDRAEALYQESLTIRRELGDRFGTAGALSGLARLALARGDRARAAALLRESLTIRDAVGDRAGAAECLEALAQAVSDPGTAGVLLSAGAALRGADGIGHHRPEQAGLADYVASLKAALGPEAFESAWRTGSAMTPREAYDFALKVTV